MGKISGPYLIGFQVEQLLIFRRLEGLLRNTASVAFPFRFGPCCVFLNFEPLVARLLRYGTNETKQNSSQWRNGQIYTLYNKRGNKGMKAEKGRYLQREPNTNPEGFFGGRWVQCYKLYNPAVIPRSKTPLIFRSKHTKYMFKPWNGNTSKCPNTRARQLSAKTTTKNKNT